MGRTAVQTDADLIAYQRELVRTGNYFPIGRAQKISIGPSADWQAPASDPVIARFGRLIDFRDKFLPIAQSKDKTLLLATSPLPAQPEGRIGLPDLPDPTWSAPTLTREEIEGVEKTRVVDGRREVYRELPPFDAARRLAPFVPQRLTDRCEMVGGQPAVMQGTDFLIFQPVIRIAFQPELENRVIGSAWVIEFSPVGDRHCAFLVDHKTGESFFFGGRYDIFTAVGE